MKPTYQQLTTTIGILLAILKDETPWAGLDKINREDNEISIAEKIYKKAVKV